MDMPVREIANAFVRDYKLRGGTRSLDERSQRAYKGDLIAFFNSFQGLSPFDLREESLRNYIKTNQNVLSSATLRRRALVITRFLNSILKSKINYIQILRSSGVPDFQRGKRSLPLTAQEFEETCRYISNSSEGKTHSYFHKRDIFGLNLMYFTGITIPELSNINKRDIVVNPEGLEICVNSPSLDVSRVLTIKVPTDSSLRNYHSDRESFIAHLKEDRDIDADNTEKSPLLLNKNGGRIDPRSIRRRVEVCFKELGINKSPLSFRSAYILKLIEGETNPEEMASLLGITRSNIMTIIRHFKKNHEGEEPSS